MENNFWLKSEAPMIGMAPMDGVTDACFRYLVCKYSAPSFVMTEFNNVEGLARGACVMLNAFKYDEIERPIVAQLFGVEIESFYKAAVLAAHLGFDGVDVNMGCPVNKIAKKGSGAGLIKTPELARKIIATVKVAIADYANGITLEGAGVHPDIIEAVKGADFARREIPVSVKTRIGYGRENVSEWIGEIVKERPASICLHGRTLKQLYSGRADWDAISRAGKIAHEAGINFIGNGDVCSLEDAKEKIAKYGVDGVLVGRAVFGNPWFFSGKEPTQRERVAVIKEHMRLMEEKYPFLPMISLRKHFCRYAAGFGGAKEMRMKLMTVGSSKELAEILG